MLVEDGRQRFRPSVFNVRITENPFFGAVFELKTPTAFEQKVEVILHEHKCSGKSFFVIGAFIDASDFLIHCVSKVPAPSVYQQGP